MKNEQRLIDINKFEKLVHNHRATYLFKEDVLAAIANQHTVDAVVVVRCKNCMWARPKDNREPTDTPRELICQCAHHHPIPAPWHARMAVQPDDFCSYGELRGSANV